MKRKPTPKQAVEREAIARQRVETATRRIVERFKAGDLPEALAPVFLQHRDGAPCRGWSWCNQLLAALAGFDDVRTYLDWQKVGRHVRQGEKAFYILEPLKRTVTEKDEQSGEDVQRTFCAGFKAGARFGYEQTEGEELPGRAAARVFLAALPLVDVAKVWGLKLGTFNGRDGKALGWFSHTIDGEGRAIALGVENMSTWAHELVHAADLRNKTLVTGHGQQETTNEIVAELGGAVLLTLIGQTVAADLGGCCEYVREYAERAEKRVDRVCLQLLKRICDNVQLILDTAATIGTSTTDTSTAADKAVA